jgi:hypothetical protein
MGTMKAADLRQCALCKQGVMHAGVPLFWRVSLQRMGVDMAAVRREAGLEMMLGGHVALARIMGPNEDIAAPIGESVEIVVCETCAAEQTSIYRLGLPE